MSKGGSLSKGNPRLRDEIEERRGEKRGFELDDDDDSLKLKLKKKKCLKLKKKKRQRDRGISVTAVTGKPF